MKKLAVLISLCIIFTTLAFADDLPKPIGYLNDFAGVIDAGRAQQIESACGSIEKSSGVEIAVVTIDSLGNSTIESEALRYLDGWGVGQKGKDNGVVILVAYKDREVRIETGYGMEGDLPDGLAGEIIRYDIIPRFKQGDYGGGLLAAVYKIGKIAGGEVVTYPKSRRGKSSIGHFVYIIFIFFFIISSFFRRRRRGGGLGALWLLTGYGLGSSSRSGFSGGSSGGFSSFGGFGGGTGGGGGASGSW